jgi:SAM-dependent methyltransferase
MAGNPKTLARLATWLDRHPVPKAATGAALDVGCGPGRLLFDLAARCPEGAIGFDLRLGMLRLARRLLEAGEASLPWRVHGRTFEPLTVRRPRVQGGAIRLVQGNLYRAPFEPEAHPLVAALSLLDVLPDPAAGLDALGALVAPGGLLLIASPYQWEASVTPPDRWWPEPAGHLRAALAARGFVLLEEAEALPWVIPSHDRLAHCYSLHAVLARRRR